MKCIVFAISTFHFRPWVEPWGHVIVIQQMWPGVKRWPKPKAIERQVTAYRQSMEKEWEELPPYFVTSAANKQGLNDLALGINSILKEIQSH